MFRVSKKMCFDSAHFLKNYPGVCSRIHGHTYFILAYFKGDKLDDIGILVDFRTIKYEMQQIIDKLDHTLLNDIVSFNPTAELLAKYFYESLRPKIEKLEKIRVYETPDSWAEYWEEETL